MTLKERIKLAIQTLGAPVTDYSPTTANVERQIIIERTVAILKVALYELNQDSLRDLNGD